MFKEKKESVKKFSSLDNLISAVYDLEVKKNKLLKKSIEETIEIHNEIKILEEAISKKVNEKTSLINHKGIWFNFFDDLGFSFEILGFSFLLFIESFYFLCRIYAKSLMLRIRPFRPERK